jgi:hypothetical protein
MKKEDIETWLNNFGITKYTINEDLTIDVDESVNLRKKELTNIPVQFGHIKGSFDCSGNKLMSLKGCPHTIDSYFDCSSNELVTLEFCPKIVVNGMECDNNQLVNLKGAPENLKGTFNCQKNKLTSLEGSPKIIHGSFNCGYNLLTSLEYGPKQVGSDYNCWNNKIISILNFDCKIEDEFRHGSDHIIPEIALFYDQDGHAYVEYSDLLDTLEKLRFKEQLDSKLPENNTVYKKIKI